MKDCNIRKEMNDAIERLLRMSRRSCSEYKKPPRCCFDIRDSSFDCTLFPRTKAYKADRELIIKAQNYIIDNFEHREDWGNKHQLLDFYHKKINRICSADIVNISSQENIVVGCSEEMWIKAIERNGRLYYIAHGGNIVLRGMAAMLIETVEGRLPENIIETDLVFIEKTGLFEHIDHKFLCDEIMIIDKIKQCACRCFML